MTEMAIIFSIENVSVSIFETETGSIERRKLLMTMEDKNSKKEPKPGESYFKLKSELGRKIEERRREAIAKRLQEEEKAKKLDEKDDEEYELGSSDEETDSKKPLTKIDGDTEEMVLDESDGEDGENNGDEAGDETENEEENAVEKDSDNDENDSSEEDSDGDGEELNEDLVPGSTQPRRRIITMDDSDDDGKLRLNSSLFDKSIQIHKHFQSLKIKLMEAKSRTRLQPHNKKQALSPRVKDQHRSQTMPLDSLLQNNCPEIFLHRPVCLVKCQEPMTIRASCLMKIMKNTETLVNRS